MAEAFSLTRAQRRANKLLARHEFTLLRGGARSGKTFLICRAIIIRGARAPGTNHAIFRFRRNSLKATAWATCKDALAKCYPELSYAESLSELTITLPNGACIWFGGLDDKERVDKILGMEFSTLFFNECSQMPWGSVETAMSRLAEKSGLKLRAYFDQNPTNKLHWSFQLFKRHLKPGTREAWPRPDALAEMRINPSDNRENISEGFFGILEGMSAAKRKRFESGEWSEETEGALWTIESLDRTRVAASSLPDMQRIVVGVDPSGTAGDPDKNNDDVGIVVAGKGVDGRYYVLADYTCNLGPSGWARQVSRAVAEWQADLVVAEVNFGGAMVKAVLKAADSTIPFKEVRASRGKVARAEPIAVMYEEGKISHAGTFEALEDELCAMTTRGFIGEGSPDRVDSAVWALTELCGKAVAMPQVRSL